MTWRAWTQYRPRTAGDVAEGLMARLADPVWLLARQWQLGEFAAEDAGSPLTVQVQTAAYLADGVSRNDTTVPYVPAAHPLEAVVESEPASAVGPDLRLRARWGLLLAERLHAAGRPADAARLRTAFGFSAADLAARGADAYARAVVGRAPDAARIAAHFGAPPTTAAELHVAFPGATDVPALTALVDGWVAAYRAQLVQHDAGDAWVADRFEYSFDVSVPTDSGRMTLRAAQYHGGRLDWDAFDVVEVAPTTATAPVLRRRQTVLATALTYPGMPAPRFWEFEDAAIDFGDPGATDRDLGRLLLAEVALVWGNDWFHLPVEAPAGSLVKVEELLVTDTFGVTTRIPAQHRTTPFWRLGQLTRPGRISSPDDYLWVAPVLPATLESRPVEEVQLRRDEAANVAWAVEAVVASRFGVPVGLGDAPRPRATPAALRPHTDLVHRLVPDLPEHWFPMVPVRQGPDGTLVLVLAGLIDNDGQDPPRPQGRLLAGATSGEPVRLREEELTRSGFTVTRTWQVGRWYDGRRRSWIGRARHAGAGELVSELEYDVLLEQ